MIFRETPLAGVFTIALERHGDDRGSFARMFCEDEFEATGLQSRFSQINNSVTAQAGTLRGLHYQLPPAEEVKVVRCTRGVIWDVALDVREGSPTFGKSFGVELTASSGTMLYVPHGFAHGFLTLADDVETIYLVSERYSPECERGVRWDDPRFELAWPRPPSIVSDKDRRWPYFDPSSHWR